MNRPITIAGGGLAGLSLGILLRQRDIPVIIHEAGGYPRHRVCGEFICGFDRERFEMLGIGEQMRDCPGLSSTTWWKGNRLVNERNLPKPAIGISRYRLDHALAEEFKRLNGDLRCRSRRYPDRQPGTITATGKPLKAGRKWLALKCHATDYPLASDLEMHLGQDGYAGVSGIENNRVNICGLFRFTPGIQGSLRDRLFAHLNRCGMHSLSRRLEASQIDDASLTGTGGFQLGRQRHASGECVLGDGFALIPPFSGNGMSMAFESAWLAAGPVADYSCGRVAWPDAVQSIDRALQTQFGLRMKIAGVLNPLLLDLRGIQILSLLARFGLIPFRTLFRSLRTT